MLMPMHRRTAMKVKNGLVLDSATDCAGWCAPGVVAICGWDHDLSDWWSLEMEAEHRHIPWTEPQARAYQLLHILPHELGHHHDRITTRSGHHASRGEPCAEAYANSVLERVFPSYARAFDL